MRYHRLAAYPRASVVLRTVSEARRTWRPDAIRDALAKQDKWTRKIAREMGVGVRVVQRVKTGA